MRNKVKIYFSGGRVGAISSQQSDPDDPHLFVGQYICRDREIDARDLELDLSPGASEGAVEKAVIKEISKIERKYGLSWCWFSKDVIAHGKEAE